MLSLSTTREMGGGRMIPARVRKVSTRRQHSLAVVACDISLLMSRARASDNDGDGSWLCSTAPFDSCERRPNDRRPECVCSSLVGERWLARDDLRRYIPCGYCCSFRPFPFSRVGGYGCVSVSAGVCVGVTPGDSLRRTL